MEDLRSVCYITAVMKKGQSGIGVHIVDMAKSEKIVRVMPGQVITPDGYKSSTDETESFWVTKKVRNIVVPLIGIPTDDEELSLGKLLGVFAIEPSAEKLADATERSYYYLRETHTDTPDLNPGSLYIYKSGKFVKTAVNFDSKQWRTLVVYSIVKQYVKDGSILILQGINGKHFPSYETVRVPTHTPSVGNDIGKALASMASNYKVRDTIHLAYEDADFYKGVTDNNYLYPLKNIVYNVANPDNVTYFTNHKHVIEIGSTSNTYLYGVATGLNVFEHPSIKLAYESTNKADNCIFFTTTLLSPRIQTFIRNYRKLSFYIRMSIISTYAGDVSIGEVVERPMLMLRGLKILKGIHKEGEARPEDALDITEKASIFKNKKFIGVRYDKVYYRLELGLSLPNRLETLRLIKKKAIVYFWVNKKTKQSFIQFDIRDEGYKFTCSNPYVKSIV